MWFRRKLKVVHDISIDEYTAAIDRIKSNAMFKDSIGVIIDFELGTLNNLWWGEQDNDTLRAYQGQARALYELKLKVSHNPVMGVKEK